MSRRKIRVVGAMLEQEPGRYLITQRSKTASLPLLWEFPGGRAHDDERRREALARELQGAPGHRRRGATSRRCTCTTSTPTYDVDFRVFRCTLKDPAQASQPRGGERSPLGHARRDGRLQVPRRRRARRSPSCWTWTTDVHQFPKDIGWIEVICGSMFSGKTEELIRRVKRARLRQAEGAGLQAEDRQPLRRDRGGEPLAAEASIATPIERAEEILQALRARHRGGGHRRGAVPRRRGGAGVRGAGRAAGCASSAPGSTRTTRASPSSRCRSCSRWPSTSPRSWPSAWCAATRPTARQRIVGARRAGGGGRGRAPTRRAAASATCPSPSKPRRRRTLEPVQVSDRCATRSTTTSRSG